MKHQWNKEYIARGIYIFLIAAAIIVFLLILLNIPAIFTGIKWILNILSPFIWGFAFAYLLNAPVHFFEKKVFVRLNKKKPHPQLVKNLSVFCVVFFLFALLFGLFYILIPQLFKSITVFIDRLPSYFDEFVFWFSSIAEKIGFQKESLPKINWEQFSKLALNYLNKLNPSLAESGVTVTASIISAVTSGFIAFISGIYLMLSKEKFIPQAKKLAFAFFSKNSAERFVKLFRETHRAVSIFISTKIFISFIIGLVTFLVLTILGVEYSILIAVVTFLLNLIPFFGPLLSAAISIAILLITDPFNALWFLILTVLLQLIDGQILTPKLLGNSMGISAFWVLFSIIVGGSIAGPLGMILGVPIFAVIYALIREFANKRLDKKGLSKTASDYASQKRSSNQTTDK